MASPTPLAVIRELLAREALPCAVVDVDAFDANLASLIALAGARPTIRLATKSIRSVPLIARALEMGGRRVSGLMTYGAAETAFLSRHGFDDLLLAYPTLSEADLDLLATLAAEGRRVAVAVDAQEHVDALAGAATRRSTTLRVIVDADMSYRMAGGRIHLGVRRSGLRTPDDVLGLARRVRVTGGVAFAGVLAYEAQIAGLPDVGPLTWLDGPVRRLLKASSRRDVARRRAAIVGALRTDGFEVEIVNGGGTGSLASTSVDPSVTEVTAGSGLFCPHLFDGYRGLALRPAAFFALQVVRSSDPGCVTCLGGGYVASGEAGRDRLPRPVEPPGLTLLRREGAGEVQTPLAVAPGARAPRLGEPVLFRHAKAGELCERFDRLVLVQEGRIVDRVPTYRGEGFTSP